MASAINLQCQISFSVSPFFSPRQSQHLQTHNVFTVDGTEDGESRRSIEFTWRRSIRRRKGPESSTRINISCRACIILFSAAVDDLHGGKWTLMLLFAETLSPDVDDRKFERFPATRKGKKVSLCCCLLWSFFAAIIAYIMKLAAFNNASE